MLDQSDAAGQSHVKNGRVVLDDPIDTGTVSMSRNASACIGRWTPPSIQYKPDALWRAMP